MFNDKVLFLVVIIVPLLMFNNKCNYKCLIISIIIDV